MKTSALIVAAGRGRRLGSETPKQYLPLDDKCALFHSARAFLSHPGVSEVQVVIHAGDEPQYAEAVAGLTPDDLLPFATGGATRGASVRAGLERLASHAPDAVLIHDAARPFVPSGVISRVIDALGEHEGACAALPVVDALWRSDGTSFSAPVSRDGLWRAQTPQGFRFEAILNAHKASDAAEAADDVAVARAAGIDVALVEGAEAAYKITTPDDLERARADARRTGAD